MGLVLFGAPKAANVLVRLDDPAVLSDEGSAIPTPYFTTADVDLGPAGGSSRFRRVIQAVIVSGNSSVSVTPIANGAELSGQAETFVVSSADGAEQRVEHHISSMATRHAVVVRAESIGGSVAVGECDFVIVPRRSIERA